MMHETILVLLNVVKIQHTIASQKLVKTVRCFGKKTIMETIPVTLFAQSPSHLFLISISKYNGIILVTIRT